MTENDELVGALVNGKGMTLYEGKDDDVAPLLPYLMMDAMYQIYCKSVLPFPAKGEMKKIKSAWSNCYKFFNHSFLICFTSEQRDAIMNKMDDFEDSIENDVMFVKVAIMNCFSSLDIDKQKMIADCLTCNILAQCAQITWGRVYKRVNPDAARAFMSKTIEGQRNYISKSCHYVAPLRDSFNKDIEGVRVYSRKFLTAYYREGETVDINDSKPLTRAVDNLCRKMVRWMKQHKSSIIQKDAS